MAKGAYYPVYQTLYIYTDTFSAASYGSNYVSTIKPNTGSDSGTYNAIYDGEKGNVYVDTSYGWGYKPTLMLWWVRETYGGVGWAIGWTNDSKNAGASVPTLSTSSTDIGNSVTVNFNRQSQNFTHTIWWRLSGGSWYTLVTKTNAASYAWNTNNNKSALLGLLPGSVSGSFEIYVSTYNGSTEVGHKSVYLTLKVPSSIKPTIGSIKAEETNSKLKNTLKVASFVKGLSKIKVSATGVAAGQGSSIKSYTWQIYNTTKTGASPTFSPLSFGSGVFKLTVSDKRGRSTTYKGSNITQVSYSQPSITSFSGSRYNDTNKTQVQVVLKATQTKLSNKNTMRYKLEYKKSTETAWKQLKAYSSYQLGDFNVTTVQTIANDAKYNVRVSVQDKLGNTTTSILTVASTSRKWLEVTNGEDINVIGNLMNNGVGFSTLDGRITTAEQNIEMLQHKNIFNNCTWSSTGTYSSRVVLVLEQFRLVYVHLGHDAGSSITASKWIMQLPSQYRPTLTRSIPWDSKSTSGMCEVDAEGVMRAYVKSGDSERYFNVNGFIPY